MTAGQTPDGSSPPDSVWRGKSLPAVEHSELAGLRTQNAELREALAAATAALGLTADSPQVIQSYLSQAANLLAKEAIDAQRAARAFNPPATQGLDAELSQPRQTYSDRVSGLAGWNHNVLVVGPRKTGKTQLAVNLAAGLSKSSLGFNWPALHAFFSRTGPLPGPDMEWRPGRFLGFSTCFMAGNVGYVNAEMDADDFCDCFRTLLQGASAAAGSGRCTAAARHSP